MRPTLENGLRATLVAAISFLFLVQGAPAAQKGQEGNSLDCGDPWYFAHCIECCNWPSPDCSADANACCPGPIDECGIINLPPPKHISLSVGTMQLVFDSRMQGHSSGTQFFQVTLQGTFRPKVPKGSGPTSFKIKTRLTGADAAVGSLLYPVAFLGNGSDPIGALRAQGYDVSIMGDAPTENCETMLGNLVCTMLATQLSRSIDASLTLGDAAAHDAFLTGAQALGFPPCQAIIP